MEGPLRKKTGLNSCVPEVVDFNGPLAIKDRILTQNDDFGETAESPFWRRMEAPVSLRITPMLSAIGEDPRSH